MGCVDEIFDIELTYFSSAIFFYSFAIPCKRIFPLIIAKEKEEKKNKKMYNSFISTLYFF